ncbi:rdiA, partial [Symbiodinium microadriaticum]
KYKESLLGAAAHGDLGDPNDPRRIIVTEFRVKFEESEGHDDIVYNLDTEEGLARLRTNGISIKEAVKYKFVISFRVQHEICAGLKYYQTLKKAIFSDNDEIMIGSYPPASVSHVFEFPRNYYNEAPKGMMYRGRYHAKNCFVDSDGVNHLEYEYDINITKNWE